MFYHFDGHSKRETEQHVLITCNVHRPDSEKKQNKRRKGKERKRKKKRNQGKNQNW